MTDTASVMAVVSSSNNCAAVLEAAGLADLFDVRVDGLDITRLALSGKPAPDAFLEAARGLEVEPSRAVVVEHAMAGVEAGRAGGFGSVIGVDRGGRSLALRQAGADVVVTSLAQVQVATEPPSAWSLVFDGFDPAKEGIREALCTLGNGYFATRAAALGAVDDGIHYPGTYLAGGYNRLQTDVAGRVVENEDRCRAFAPSADAWNRSGDLLSEMARTEGLEIGRLSKSFANDVLLALSCC